MVLETFTPVTPVNFFQLRGECHYCDNPKDLEYAKYRLPDTSSLCDEESFAAVSMGWNESGLLFLIDCSKPLEEVEFPEFRKGDSVELMIDTRDVKTSGYNTRFCHHFYFLPKPVNVVRAGEITHFRTDDTHALCAPDLLEVDCKMGKRSFSLSLFIPQECLHGYDPGQVSKLGLNYRINRHRGDPQHFSAISEDYPIEQLPSLWASIRLSQ